MSPASKRSSDKRETSDRMWLGVTGEDRRSDRRKRLIAAGVEIMGSAGVHAVTVRAICRAASISERHFYEAFHTKDDFVLAVYNDVIDQAFAMIGAITADASNDKAGALSRFVNAWIDFVQEDPRRGRIVAVEAAANRALARRGRQVAATMLSLFLDYTSSPSTGEASRHDPTSLEVTATVLVSGIWGLLLAWMDDALDTSIGRDELTDHIVELVLRALPS